MEYYIQHNLDDNIVQYVFKANDNTLHGICVNKDINQEDALQMLIDVHEDDNSPLGLS